MKSFFRNKRDNEVVIKNTVALKGGTYSMLLTGIVLGILIVINVMFSNLPESLTQFDISSTKLYSITSNTKVVVNSLEQDVTIYWIVQSDMEDSVIENLLNKYESLSKHINVVKKNPDVYPTFAAQYTDETVTNNSLVVECGAKSRYISYEDIYLTDIDYTTYSLVYSFDGEGAITSAIDYVVSEELPSVYVLEGHGEAELSDEFREQIEKENMELVSFSLLTQDEIPDEADCIIIYAPSSDISKEEEEMLSDYVKNGGKLLVFAGPIEEGTLENLYQLLKEYDVTAEEGIVVEGNRNYYAFGAPYIMLPDIESDEITDALIEENYYAIVPLALGLTVDDDNSMVTTLLMTSEDAYSKVDGYSLTTYEAEEDDILGPFALAVKVEDYSGGKMVWVSSSKFLDEMYNAYSSGANLDFSMNALSALIGESEAVAIRSKSLGYNYLTINESTAVALKVTMIGILPIAIVIFGIYVIVERKKRKNE